MAVVDVMTKNTAYLTHMIVGAVSWQGGVTIRRGYALFCPGTEAAFPAKEPLTPVGKIAIWLQHVVWPDAVPASYVFQIPVLLQSC